MKFGTEYPRRCIGSRPSDIDIFTIVLSDNDDRVGTWTREKHYTGGASAVVVPNIVAWQEEDMSLFPTPYASALAQRMGVEFPQSSASAAAPGSSIPELPLETNLPPPPQQTQNEGKRGLSPGAKAGVGIVVAAVVIGLVSVILFLRRRRRRRDFSPPEAHDQEDLPEFVASPGETKSFLGGIGNMSAIWRDREKGRHSVAGDGGAVQVQARWADDASQVLPPSSPVEMQAERDVSEMGGPKTPTTKLGPEGGR